MPPASGAWRENRTCRPSGIQRGFSAEKPFDRGSRHFGWRRPRGGARSERAAGRPPKDREKPLPEAPPPPRGHPFPELLQRALPLVLLEPLEVRRADEIGHRASEPAGGGRERPVGGKLSLD